MPLLGQHAVHVERNVHDVTHLRAGIIMPRYACTLSNVPTPIRPNHALTMFTRMSSTLKFVHDHAWLHGDVKPSNIFIDFLGNAWLGDYGSSICFDDLRNYTGGTPSFQCSDVDVILSPSQFDCIGLVITFLVKLDLLNVRNASACGWPLEAVSSATKRVEHVPLKAALEASLSSVLVARSRVA